MNDNWAHHVNEKFCEETRLATAAPVERCIELKQENAELRTEIEKNAEVLRCAEEQTRLADIGGRASWVNYQNACIATCDAVRAREEIDK